MLSAGSGNARALPAAFLDPRKSDDFIAANCLVEPNMRQEFYRQTLQNLDLEIQKAKHAGCHTFLISSEHFQSRLTLADEVQRCAKCFKARFDEVLVVVYLRRQDRLAVSRFSEYVRAGHVIDTPLFEIADLRQGGMPEFYNHSGLLARWASAFGSDALHPRIYESRPGREWSVVEDFSRAIGTALHPTTDSNNRPRIELSARAQQAALLFNAEMGSDNRLHPVLSALRETLLEWLANNFLGLGMRPTRQEATEFLSFFEEDNRQVAKDWSATGSSVLSTQPSSVDSDVLPVPSSRYELFDSDVSEYPIERDARDTSSPQETLRKAVADLGIKAQLSALCEDLGRQLPEFVRAAR